MFTARNIHSAAAWTSVDVLLTGAGLSAWDINVFRLLIAIGSTTLIAASAGLYTGYLLGYEQNKKAYISGGVILIGVGIYISVKAFF